MVSKVYKLFIHILYAKPFPLQSLKRFGPLVPYDDNNM